MDRQLGGLYVIVDPEATGDRDLVKITKAAVKGGADVVQLRGKRMSGLELFRTACAVRDVCRSEGVVFIVNDRADVAVSADADGVHVGQEDLPIRIARQVVGPERIVGASVKTVDMAREAVAEGADYIGVGAMFGSPTKPLSSVVGTERLRAIRDAIDIPIVGIGGVNLCNAREVIDAGADGVAVISAVVGVEAVEGAARGIKKRIERSDSGQA